jgi:hypothetical protein
MKKGKLSNLEQWAIMGMWFKGENVGDIAIELDRSETLVQKYLDENAGEPETATEEEAPEGKNKSLFIRKTAGKGNVGVSISNESESFRSDATRAQRLKKKPNPKTTHVIHKD